MSSSTRWLQDPNFVAHLRDTLNKDGSNEKDHPGGFQSASEWLKSSNGVSELERAFAEKMQSALATNTPKDLWGADHPWSSSQVKGMSAEEFQRGALGVWQSIQAVINPWYDYMPVNQNLPTLLAFLKGMRKSREDLESQLMASTQDLEEMRESRKNPNPYVTKLYESLFEPKLEGLRSEIKDHRHQEEDVKIAIIMGITNERGGRPSIVPTEGSLLGSSLAVLQKSQLETKTEEVLCHLLVNTLTQVYLQGCDDDTLKTFSRIQEPSESLDNESWPTELRAKLSAFSERELSRRAGNDKKQDDDHTTGAGSR